MIKKGIILAGGSGTRMSPITKAVNKQLLPLYDKPLFFYPLSVLMLAKIKDILIIVNKGQINQFKRVLPNGNNLGIKISYIEQDSPKGLPDAFIIGKNFIGKDSVALILGDNFFFGQSLTRTLIKCSGHNTGARVFLHPVKNPSSYGVATVNKKNQIIKIVEKPKKSKSNLAITGLYFFDNDVIQFSRVLKPSKRKELEITDLLKKYKKINKLHAEYLGRGGTWLDTGTIEDFHDASSFVSTIEKRQGLKISCLEEISLRNKWINNKEIYSSIKHYGNCEYSKYLKRLINNSF
jgi:glucose-1-phosphate thymidylyltransferase